MVFFSAGAPGSARRGVAGGTSTGGAAPDPAGEEIPSIVFFGSPGLGVAVGRRFPQ
jgi:hypothetical protein